MKKIRNSRANSLLKLNQNFEEYSFGELDLNPLFKEYMIREAFNMFDEDGSGDIDKKEFRKLVQTLGLQLNEKKINELIGEIDKDGSGTIDYDEFFLMMSKFQFGKDSDILLHLVNSFNEYDKDMDMNISAEDFKKVSEEFDKEPISNEMAEKFVRICKYFANEQGLKNNTNNNLVNFEEYVNCLIKTKFLYENHTNNNSFNKTLNSLNQSNLKSINFSYGEMKSEGKLSSFLKSEK